MSSKTLAGSDFKVHCVTSKEELAERARQINYKRISNLNQLCEWDKVGKYRTGRGKADGWSELKNVKWIKHTSSNVLLPMYGHCAPDLVKNWPQLHGVAATSLQKLFNGALGHVRGWTCLNAGKTATAPAFVARLRDGDTLLGHRVDVAKPNDPDFGALYPTMPPASGDLHLGEVQVRCSAELAWGWAHRCTARCAGAKRHGGRRPAL